MKTAVPSLLKKAAAGIALSMAMTTAQAQEVLNFYNWSDYIAEDTLAKFEAETGIKVIYDVYESNETLEAKLLAGNSGYDLVVPSSNFMERQIKAGIFEKLDKSKLTNMSNLDTTMMSKLAQKDPDNSHGIPYLWGTTGIAYNTEMVAAALGDDAPVNSWDLVFNPKNMEKLAECGVTFLDSPDEVYPLALIYTGNNPNSTAKADHKSSHPAAQTLKSVRPYVRQFTSGSYINDLANGDICVAISFSGDAFQAQARAEEAENGVDIAYTIPKEGAEMWFDMLMIPKGAPNAENAHKFINFLLRPEIIAEITDYVWYANPNSKATALIDQEIAQEPSIYPPQEVQDNLYTSVMTPPKIARMLNRLWSDLKTGR